MGKAAKLESRPENANRANPELRALGHQTPNETPNAFTAFDHTGHHCSPLTPYPASSLAPYRPRTTNVPDNNDHNYAEKYSLERMMPNQKHVQLMSMLLNLRSLR